MERRGPRFSLKPGGKFLAIFASCIFSELRAARFRHASQIRTKATPCVQVWQTSNLGRLRLDEEKRKIDRSRMWANAQRDGRPAESTPQSFADAH